MGSPKRTSEELRSDSAFGTVVTPITWGDEGNGESVDQGNQSALEKVLEEKSCVESVRLIYLLS